MTDSSTSDEGQMLSPARLIEGGVELAGDAAEFLPTPAAGLELFDIFELSRRLEFDGDGVPSAGSDEDFAQSRQRALWRRLYNDPRGAWRSLVIPDAEMIARIDALDLICPHCSDVTGWVSPATELHLFRPRGEDADRLLGIIEQILFQHVLKIAPQGCESWASPSQYALQPTVGGSNPIHAA